MTDFMDGPDGRKLAFNKTSGEGPGVVFLGGFMSDMAGSKATFLEEWAKGAGRSYLRFDYSGHGESGGEFTDGCIGDWAADAISVISEQTEGPQILVGSSMGGWISSLVIKAIPDRIAGFVGIAAAPDFTEDYYWAGFDAAQRDQVMKEGIIYIPSDYGDPYPITRRLIEDGRDQLVMRSPLVMDFPVRLLIARGDAVVKTETQLALMDHISGDDVRATIVKGGDHSFSSPENLTLIRKTIHSVTMATQHG